MPVKICRDTQGVAHRISADAFMGNPEGGALAALLGFTAAQCRSDYDLLSGSLSYDCQSASREFVTTLSGAPGTHTLYGYQLGHAPVAVFDSGSAK
jgi:hypothetical protein